MSASDPSGAETRSPNLPVTLSRLQAMSNLRKNRWHEGGAREWSPLEWAGAMCGEAGEAANVGVMSLLHKGAPIA